ncbi:SnoaL-like polyketide cyclase [Streptomyces sp. A7024]|uniref:SnoaL-like polyketide cyclase n=1 Tax=Streptomyces coryli TaxID=1128680 RepID=A0A6G4U4M3_9ACTN|nr:SnoaL-like polyketide cyclase [Streptomyces coryli]NGN66690.1 SnoaL-like polyketide cyclase [Streptomyces coryli]
MQETPIWLQGRDAVVAAAEPEDWRDEAPGYEKSHELMPRQRTHEFEPGSLEAVVESIVQVFEMEVSHKKDPATWVSMVTEHFRTNVNGGPWVTAADIAATGSYNILIGDSVFYRKDESFESSHEVFHQAFPGGFFWEVLEVLSPPPFVAFKWRHWGGFDGEYHGFAPHGETVEMFGMSVAKVDDDLRLLEVEHYYDPNAFLGQLTGGCPVAHTAHTPEGADTP